MLLSVTCAVQDEEGRKRGRAEEGEVRQKEGEGIIIKEELNSM